MPSFQVTAPDGRAFKVTVPDGVTQQQVISRLATSGMFDPPADSPALSKITNAPVPKTVDEARARDNVADPGEGWMDIGSKFLNRVGPLFKQSIGGIAQGLSEMGGAPPNAPLTGFEQEEIRREAEEMVRVARAQKIVPGQQLAEQASADLKENGYNPGDSTLKKYVPAIAESVVQMVPAIAAAFATRNPSTAGTVMGAQVGGAQYAESAESGRTPAQAGVDAAFMAAAESIGEKIPVGILMQPGGKFLSRTLKAMGAEGLQEMFTQTLQTGYDKGVLTPDMTWDEAFAQVRDAGIIGSFTGGALSVGVGAVDKGGRIISDKLAARRPVADGVKAQAVQATVLSPEDEASPIPTELIAKGKDAVAQALGGGNADAILERQGMPKTGAQVQIDMGDGRVLSGVMSDAFEEGEARGLVITLPDGRLMREHFDDLADAGVTISPRSEADTIDAQLAEQAQRALAGGPDATPATPEGVTKPVTPKGAGPRPVTDAKAIVEELYPDAVVTSWKRDKSSALSKANPKSWHANSAAAVDVAPIKGKTFEQFVQGFRDKGYDIIEAIDEVKHPSKHATGPHWHVVLGERTGDVQTAEQVTAPQESAAPSDVPATEQVSSDSDIPSLLAEMPDPTARARELAIGLMRDGKTTTGFDDDVTYAFGHRMGNMQGSYNTPGKVNLEMRSQPGVIHSFDVKDLQREIDGTAAPSTPQETAENTPAARVESTATGKSVAIFDASEAQLAAIKAAIPNAQPIQRKDGATIYSKKYEAKISEALATGTRAAPAVVETAQDIDAAAAHVAAPTEAQKEAGNYRKAHVQVQGLDISIENPKGSTRSGTDPNGETWSVTMPDHYGYVKRTTGADGEHVDVYVGPEPQASTVFVVDQNDAETGAFDEHKAMIGYPDEASALAAYEAAFSDGKGKQRIGSVTPMAIDEFKGWLATNPTAPAAEEHPGLVVKSLQTGNETVIQPRGTVPARSNAERHAEIDAGFAENRAVLGNFKKGDRVEWDHANFYADGRSRTFSGVVDKVTDKEQGTIRVLSDTGGDVTAAARRLRHKSPEPNPARVEPKEQTDSPTVSTTEPAEPSPPPTDKPPAPPSGYGAKNKLVSQDRAAELRERLKAKLSGTQLNSGVDPEVLAIGAELAVFHIEAGARRFTDFAKAIARDLDMSAADLRRYLRGWYNGARDMMEDMGESVVGMDTPDEVARAVRSIDDWAGVTAAPANAMERADGDQGTLPRSDAAASPGDVSGAAPQRSAELAPSAEERGSASPVRQSDEGRTQVAERGGEGSAGATSGGGTGSRDADRLPAQLKGANWTITPGALDEARSPSQKARDNVAAIEIVTRLDAEGRMATAEEQAAIAKYVGWGGLKNIFPGADGQYGKGFETLGPRLRELLTDEQYDTARRSIQYAHYTSEKVIRPMWELARSLGFKGGLVFEPGMGTGNFLGMMPGELAQATRYEGVEFDHLTQRIAYHLYPQSGVRQADYTRTPQVLDAFDLVIGNPPFSQTVIKSDPAYAKRGFVMHDFFFAKSLDAVKPGGLLMFVTSAGTMNKIDTDARAYLAERADLLGAVRLPSTAFAQNAGTEVTTDIIVLRKRLPGEQPGDTMWTETERLELPYREGGTAQGAVNRYFVANPEMVLGEQGMFDTLTATPRYGVRAKAGQDLEAELSAALARIEARPIATASSLQEAQTTPAIDFDVHERKEGSFYVSDSGDLMQLQGGVGRKVEQRGKGVKGGLSAGSFDKVRSLIGIRDALRETLAADLGKGNDAATARAKLNSTYDAFVAKHGPINKTVTEFRRPTIIQQESARMRAREEARMNMQPWEEGDFDASLLIEAGASTLELARERRAARDEAKAAGRPFNEGSFDPAEMDDIAIVKRPNIDAFMADQESYRLRSIEHYDDNTDTGRKGLIFFESPLSKQTKPQIASVEDALLYTLNRVGRPDIDMIAREANVSTGEVLDRLGAKLFRVPGSDAYETAEIYLSGNVREKLEIAQRAASNDPDFQRNVRALEHVQPAPLSKADIAAVLGMPWIPQKVISQFGTEALGLTTLTAEYQPKLAQWRVTGDTTSAAARSQWGTEDRSATHLLGDALNRTTPKIYREYRDADGNKKRVLDEQATQGVQDKVIEIKAKFREWVWSDDARTSELEELYNRSYNSRVAPVFDGSYLTTPGVNAAWSWRPHQTNVIARIIQSGNTYMGHGVGAGKTSAMIGAGMEMKRLGLVNKPAYVVPNHMLGQFTKEFYEQYPTARIMVADETRFHTDRRKQFVADVANSDLDAVIMTHSSFELLPVDAEFLDGMISDQIDEYRGILEELDKSQENRITRSRIEQQIEALDQRLSVNKNARKDSVYTFEETGIDFLFVDEAHLFRKLSFSTKMGQVKGIDPDGSQAAFDLFAKVQRLEQSRPGRSVVLASGTAITNTMAELYTVQRMMQMGELRKLNLHQFDAWAGAFGDTDTKLEQDPAGGYKPVTRFSKFVNVPELSVMVRQFMDVVTSKDLDALVVRPRLKGGQRNMVVVEQNADQKEYGQQLKARMEIIEKRKRPPEKGEDILLTVINDGRKSAIDMRLIGSNYGRADSKLERLIDNVFRVWEESKRQPFHAIESTGYSPKPVDFGPATQMVFADLGVNPTADGMGVHDYIRSQLIARGVPAREIALMGNFKNTVQKQRLFNDMNEGKVRVLVGSVAKMGTGVNAQRRLLANHNLDAQWYPANDEQRNGRIIRQGNMNPEVEIYDYSTKGTYDSQMWQLMETKARFIEGFMRGDPTMRDMEDLGEASQYEQAKALTTADPRIMQLTELRQALDKGLLRKGAFERSLAQARREIRHANETIARAEERIPQIEADIAQRVDVRGDAFEASIGDIRFTERVKFGEALLEALDGLKAAKTVGGKPKLIGEMGGFQIFGTAFARAGEMEAEAFIKLNGDDVATLRETNSAAGLVSQIARKLEGFEDSLDYARSQIETSRQAIREFTPELTKTFSGEAEIDRLHDEVRKLEKELETEAAPAPIALDPEAAPDERQSRVGPVISLTGEELGEAEDIRDLGRRARAWYRQNLRLSTVTSSDGHDVRFNRTGEGKINGGDRILRAVPAIPHIIEKGVHTGPFEPNEKWRGRGAIATHSYVGKVELAGELLDFGVMVQEFADGRRFYNLTDKPEDEGVGSRSSLIEGRPSAGARVEITPDEVNLFLGSPPDNPVNDSGPALDELRTRLREVGIMDRIAGEVVATIRGDRTIAGTFSPRDFQIDGRMFKGMIRVATDVAQDRAFTIDHEIIHAMRSMNLFLPDEWRALERRARGDAALIASVKRRYVTLDDSLITEEAIADLFAGWVRDRNEKGLVGRAFDRVLAFLSALSSWAQGNGFVSAESTLRAVDAGVIGERRSDLPQRGGEMESRLDTARAALTGFAGKASTWSGQGGALFDRWRTAVQDRYLPLLRTQQAIEVQLGKPLGQSFNPYLGEELMTGRIGTKLERLSDEMLEPLFNDMHAAGIEIDELETYLYARHAPERNAQITSINPTFMPGEGSGMTDIEARAVINRIERSGKMADMQRLALQVDGIIEWSLNERIEAGLMSEEEATAWRETYANYVPLRGNVQVEGEEASIRINRGGAGLSVRGRESRRAYGRKSQAENILSYVVLQAEEAVVRGETNRVAQSFVRLAERAPDADFWAVDKVTRKPVMDPSTGLVRYEDQTRVQPEDQDFTVSAKFDGEERRVTMNRANPEARRLADSMRNLTQQQLDWVTQHLGKVNRFLSAVNTSWNPEFVITNAFRDMQTAAVNLAGVDQQGMITGTLRDYRKALVAATKGEFGRGSGEWNDWYREFKEEGGRVSFNQIEDIPGIKKKLRSAFAMAGARANPKMDMLTVKRGFIALRDTVEALNGGVENAIRLSAYKNARQGGMSKAQAASLAKNLTVNFNRRGQMGPAINAAYLFFNASMQGSARIILAMKSPRVRKVLAGVMIGGFMMELLNAMLSADDDDGESIYDKIPAYEKTRNFIIMMPDGNGYLKFPMPYGYNVFANAGRTVAEVMRRGGDRWQESGSNLAFSVLDAFNPIGGSESLLNLLAPTIADPVVDLTLNKDFSGRPIQPEQNPFAPPEPDHLNYSSSVGPHWKAVTDTVADLTGGDDVLPGAIDVSPETLEYLSGTVFGAAGGFIDRIASLGGKAISADEEVTANDIPVLRKVLGQKPSWQDKGAYYERAKQIEQAIDYAKGYIEREDWQGFEAYRDSQANLLSLEPAMKEAEREMRKIRKARREIDFAHELGKLPDDTWQEDRTRIKDAETALITAFNRRWNETMTPAK